MPFFIVNPRSAGGQTGRTWEAGILPRVLLRFPDARWALTGAAGEAARLAARAAQEGSDLVVAVGGDGTVNEVVNGLLGVALDAAGPRRGAADATAPLLAASRLPILGVAPRGTGCDFAKSLGVPRDLDGALDLVAAGRTIEADVCEIVFTDDQGRPRLRFAVNQCGCGASGEVAHRVNQAAGPQHGLLAFLVATLRVAINYRPRPVEIAVDGVPREPGNLKSLFVLNGEFCGGGMRAGRGALIDDGELRIVEVNEVEPWRAVAQLYRLYTGRLEGVRGVRVYGARSVTVRSRVRVRVDCDGEQPGELPATYTVRPAALRVRVGRSAPAVSTGDPADAGSHGLTQSG